MQDAFTSATATCAADNVDIFTVRAPPKPQINLSARVLAMMSRCNLTFLSSGAGQGERCSSANCLAAASHVMLMHGNCTAHSTWPLQARTPNRWHAGGLDRVCVISLTWHTRHGRCRLSSSSSSRPSPAPARCGEKRPRNARHSRRLSLRSHSTTRVSAPARIWTSPPSRSDHTGPGSR